MTDMALTLEETENINEVKDWFEKYGNWLVGVLLAAALIAAGNWGWRWYTQHGAEAASALYDQYEAAVARNDATRARDIAGSLVQRQGGSIYAALAALQQAKANLTVGDFTSAKAQLQWVAGKSQFPELAAVARVRLAGVLLDEKSYDAALALLQSPPPGFEADYADRRGDILLAQGKPAAARTAYQEALLAAGTQNPLRSLIQAKLDAIPAAG